MKRHITAADLFCGAGGTSTGLTEACRDLGLETRLTAVNHWDVAIATHGKNHPGARHFCASLDALNPRELFKEGELDILWASPECTHHSIARGGKPISDQSRATAWCVVRWAEALRPGVILVENVREFLTWGPIGANGRPIQSRKGEVFKAWASTLEALGYRVDWRILCAADYGDPTTRRRLFVQAVRGKRRICWPTPTHAAIEETDLLGSRKRWRAAREIIDWDKPGQSIFKRKRPLAEKTLERIRIGLEKFGFGAFTVSAGGPSRDARSVKSPLQTVLCRDSLAVAQPFLVHLRGTNGHQVHGSARPLSDPLPAITAGGGHSALIEPYLVQVAHGASVDGDRHRARAIGSPLPTIAGNRGDLALIQPQAMLLGQQSGAVARPVSEPAPTVATSGAIALVEPYIVGIDHSKGGRHVRGADAPLSTVTTENRHALCQPYLLKYYGTADAQPVTNPLDTVTAKSRFGLVQPVIVLNGERYLLDILFRMLSPREIARAQGFPDSYEFTGTKTDIVKQIGNAVPVGLTRALVRAVISQACEA